MRPSLLVPLLVALLSAAPLRAQQPAAEPGHTPAQATRTPAPSSQAAGDGSPAAARPPAEPSPATVPSVPDTLNGHLTASIGGGLAVPLGRFDSNLLQSRRVGPGLALAFSATYGVSRTVAVGIWGDMQRLSNGSACSSCSGTGFGGGALAVYHLVQGVRFDPWLAAGLGWRTTTVASDAPDVTYSGPELLRLLIGGDWYATSLLGLGPTLELSAGSYTKRPPNAGNARAYWQLQTTLRVTLDLPGK